MTYSLFYIITGKLLVGKKNFSEKISNEYLKPKKSIFLFLKFTLHRNASSLDADPARAFLFVSE